MKPVYVHGVGLAAPGLPDWQAAQAILRDQSQYLPQPLAGHQIKLLPRNEARRAGASTRLAFQAAEQACAGIDPATLARLASVFASSAADTSIAEKICADLVVSPRSVSPTQFHNSVHNAAAGYWGIATGSNAPANSLSAGIHSFAAGLMEAWTMLAESTESVLLVCFDTEGSSMLSAARPSIHASCAMALLLSRNPDCASAQLQGLSLVEAPPTRMENPELEGFRQRNPAARSLPLLRALAGEETCDVVLEATHGCLALTVAPLA